MFLWTTFVIVLLFKHFLYFPPTLSITNNNRLEDLQPIAVCQYPYFLFIIFSQHLTYPQLTKRYSKIDQHLARHFKYIGACLSSPFLCMQSNNYPFFKFNDLHQSGNRVVILAFCGIRIPLFLFYYKVSFVIIQKLILILVNMEVLHWRV